MKNILIVDDSGFARRSLRNLLLEAGYGVEEARDGHEAIEKYFIKRPDLVLLDIVMEGMDGLQVLTKLRELDPKANVIMASADIQTSTQTEAKSLGGIGYIAKPYKKEEVLANIAQVLAGGAA